MREKLTGLCAALIIVGLFLAFAGDGLFAYFTPDDMMNIYGAWFRFTNADRPMGALFYRVVFGSFGLNPLPYRIGCFLLLGANLGLLYAFCRRLTGSREIAALACVLGAYHAHLADLYYSTGTIYDLLCYAFYYSAFVYYINTRANGKAPGWWRTVGVLALYLCALLSKEMAVTLPLFLVLYDLLYLRPASGPRPWLAREARVHGPIVAVTAAYIGRKLTAPEAMIQNPDYLPHFTLRVLTNGWKHYLSDVFYGVIALNHFKIVLLWVALLAIAIALRSRALLMAWFLMLLGTLPVIFITPRGFFAVYLTLPGWYIYAATLLVIARDSIVNRMKRQPNRTALQAATLVMLAALLVPLHRARKPLANSWVPEAQAAVRGAIDPVRRYGQPLPRGASMLFLDDPYPREDYTLTFVFRLHYRDEAMVVHRVKALPAPPDAVAQSTYDRVFRLENGELKQTYARANPRAQP